jgi:hypothetical protein
VKYLKIPVEVVQKIVELLNDMPFRHGQSISAILSELQSHSKIYQDDEDDASSESDDEKNPPDQNP